MNKTIIESSLAKLKSWSKVNGDEIVVTKPKDELEFNVVITVIDNAIKDGYMTEVQFINFLKERFQ